MVNIAFIFLLASFSAVLVKGSSPHALAALDNPKGYQGCTVGGYLCSSDCAQLLLCLANQQTMAVQNCSESGEWCDVPSGSCKANGTAQCTAGAEAAFTCHAPGMFPNPYDCHTYYICAEKGSEGVLHTCPEPDPLVYGYDPLTYRCSYTMADRVCEERPVPECTTAQQAGAQPENPNIYFVCVAEDTRLSPWLFKCLWDNEVFDSSLKECVVPLDTTVTISTSTVATTTPGDATRSSRSFWLMVLSLCLPLIHAYHTTPHSR